MNDEPRGRLEDPPARRRVSSPSPQASFLPPSFLPSIEPPAGCQPPPPSSTHPPTPSSSCQFESDLDSTTPGLVPGITIRPCCRWIRGILITLLASGIIADRPSGPDDRANPWDDYYPGRGGGHNENEEARVVREKDASYSLPLGPGGRHGFVSEHRGGNHGKRVKRPDNA